MATVDVFDINNQVVGSIELSDDLFFTQIRPHLVTEVVHWQRATRRVGTQSAKTKAEVNGTTKKPFKQKGTGGARQGSLRNPHQIGGGVAFAPKPRDYSYSMPKAKRRAALAVALSARVKEKAFKVIRAIELPEAKTKQAAEMLKRFDAKKALIVDVENLGLQRSLRNLPHAKYLEAKGVNVYDILNHPALFMSEGAVRALEERLK